MFITIKVNDNIKHINIDYVYLVEPVEDSLYKCYFASATTGHTELTVDQIAYNKILEVIGEATDEDLPIPSKHQNSEVSDLLIKLHKLVGGRGEPKLTTDRRARLKTRLKDFTKEDLITAATNLGNDEFMQGANDNGKRYGTVDYLIRTSANVNKWLEEQPVKKSSLF